MDIQLSDALAIIAILISLLSLYISGKASQKQNKVALIEKRTEIFEKIRNYVNCLASWEFDYSWFEALGLSETEIHALFNKRFKTFYVHLERSSEKINILRGDYDYAKNHGQCNGRSEDEIEDEICQICEIIYEEFVELETQIRKKYLTL